MYRRETKPEIRMVTGIRDFRCGLDPFRYFDWLLNSLVSKGVLIKERRSSATTDRKADGTSLF